MLALALTRLGLLASFLPTATAAIQVDSVELLGRADAFCTMSSRGWTEDGD